jgi:uncharacterized protein
MTKRNIKNSESPTFNHFYEKLLLLKDKMNTPTGKRIEDTVLWKHLLHNFMRNGMGRSKILIAD